MKTLHLYLLLLLTGLAIACGQDDDDIVRPSEPAGLPPCELGNVRLGADSTCQCPPPGILLNGRCQVLRENEYFARNVGCPCADSMFIQFTRDTTWDQFAPGPLSIRTLVSGGAETDVPKSIIFSPAPPYGDTLYMHPVPHVDAQRCTLENGQGYLRTMRIFDFDYGMDSILAEIIVSQQGVDVDTCQMLFTQ